VPIQYALLAEFECREYGAGFLCRALCTAPVRAECIGNRRFAFILPAIGWSAPMSRSDSMSEVLLTRVFSPEQYRRGLTRWSWHPLSNTSGSWQGRAAPQQDGLGWDLFTVRPTPWLWWSGAEASGRT
jgi:hypothetical protein